MNECMVVRKEDMEAALGANPTPGKHLLESFRAFIERGFPVSIIEDSEVSVSQSELHTKEGDLVLCLEGEIDFMYGGELINPAPYDETNILGQGVRGGEKIILKAGDWLWIPAGQPHSHRCSATSRMALIKIPCA